MIMLTAFWRTFVYILVR